ncbi:MAG: fumarate reductase/succinate dehydrogenase flavoprotein subunit [Planctomycetes bacterium]|nr:fumarate reductase/succinate dehydrogenase flavoprotein subunit [Planctomycetota bacterium]
MALDIQTIEHDVLVIGAGGAGLRGAIEASNAGISVGLVCKSLLGKAHTVMAEGGVAAALANVDDRDSWKVHFADTMRGGQYVNNWRMAEHHAKEAPDRVRELEKWGAVFDRTKEGKILQRNFGGHRYPRLAHVGDRTGLEIIRTLQDKSVHEREIKVYMECTIVRLFKDGERVTGALGYFRERGRFVLFKAKSIVMATGGLGKAYAITSNSWEYTGDGYSLAYHAGADLIDMEFVQFHPTGMVWPPSVRGILVTEGVRGEGGVLRNKDGKRFMFDDIPENYRNQTAKNEEEGWRYTQGDKNAMRPPELLTRDHVARCINREVKAGRGSPHGGVFLDIAWIKERIPNAEKYIQKKLPSMYHQFKELGGIDITKERMEVGPTTHYTMGGIKVDGDSQMTTVPGLFAAGEAAGGLHGANRLGGNSLSDLLVFGKRAGENAAKFAQENKAGAVAEADIESAAQWSLSFMDSPKGDENPYKVQQDLQVMMQDLVGIVRREDEMVKALAGLKTLWERAKKVQSQGNREYNPGWHTCMDLTNLLTVSEAVTMSGIRRKESRGAQFRDDFPEKSDTYAKMNMVIRKAKDGSMELIEQPTKELPPELKQVIEEMAK